MPAAAPETLPARAADGAARHPLGAPPVRDGGPAPLDANDLTTEPDASDEPLPARRRLGMRHLLVAGLIGAVIGAAVPATFQVVDRAVAAAEVEGLRALATDYLTAIAEGRADDATAIVPLDGARAVAAPDAVLASARPTAEIETRQVHIDGDLATVSVEYRAAGRDRTLTLEAERSDAGWRLTTSLAEPVVVYANQPGQEPTVAGTPLVDRRTHLYPGRYTVDEAAGPLFMTSGEPFVVDGDPSSPVEVYTSIMLVPRVQDQAVEIALRSVEACAGTPQCRVPPGAQLTGSANNVWVHRRDESLGFAELSVQMMANDGAAAQYLDLQMRMYYDDAGTPTRWECGLPGSYEVELAPCPTID